MVDRASVLLVIFASCAALQWGCDRAPGSGDAAQGATAKTPPKVPASQPAGPRLPLFDGFEGNAIAGFWLPGDYGAGRYEPGAVTITREPARSGRGAVKITIKEGDIEQTGDDGLLTERAELDSGKHPFLNRDVWYGFSFLVPNGFPVIDNRLVIAQWKQNGIHGGPLIAQRFRAGRHDLTLRTPKSLWGSKTRYALPPIPFDRWNDMVYHIRFSTGGDGRVEVWMNGKRVVDHKGATAFESGEDLMYNKFGLYRDRWKEPMTIFFDNYTLGENYEAVDPSRFDRRRAGE